MYLRAAHEKTQRPDPTNPAINLPNNRFNNAIFDHVKVRKCYSELDGVRYPKNPIMNSYGENNYLDQNRNLKSFYKKYVREPMLSPIITYGKMKTYYPFEIIDLRFQVDHTSPNKIRIFENYDENPVNTNLYLFLIKHREIIMVLMVLKYSVLKLYERIVHLYLHLYLGILTVIRVIIQP